MTGVTNRGDHLSPQVRPRRLAVEEDDRLPVPLVEVRESQPVHLAVAGGERKVRQALEALVGGSKDAGQLAAIALGPADISGRV